MKIYWHKHLVTNEYTSIINYQYDRTTQCEKYEYKTTTTTTTTEATAIIIIIIIIIIIYRYGMIYVYSIRLHNGNVVIQLMWGKHLVPT